MENIGPQSRQDTNTCTAKSILPHWLKSAATTEPTTPDEPFNASKATPGGKEPSPLPSRMVTVLEPLVTARSGTESPLKSAAASELRKTEKAGLGPATQSA